MNENDKDEHDDDTYYDHSDTIRNTVARAVHLSLLRYCGGGLRIIIEGDGNDDGRHGYDNIDDDVKKTNDSNGESSIDKNGMKKKEQEKSRQNNHQNILPRRVLQQQRYCGASSEEEWKETLRRMSIDGISFPNGSNKSQRFQRQQQQDKQQPRQRNYIKNVDGGEGISVHNDGKDNDANIGTPHDVEVKTALSFHRRFCRSNIINNNGKSSRCTNNKKKRNRNTSKMSNDGNADDDGNSHNDDDDQVKKDGAMIMTRFEIVSDLGLARPIHSVHDLSSLISRDIEERLRYKHASTSTSTSTFTSISTKSKHTSSDHLPMNNDIVPCHHIRTDQSGTICIVTDDRSIVLRNADRLPCPYCPSWPKGSKGLWWHCQKVHDVVHEEARMDAGIIGGQMDATTALVVWKGQMKDIVNAAAVISSENNGSCGNDVDNDGRLSVVTTSIDNNSHASDVVQVINANENPFEMAKCGDLDKLQSYLLRHRKISHKINNSNNEDDTTSISSSRPFDSATTTDRNGSTLLHWAAGNGHLSIVKYLIKIQNNENNETNNNNNNKNNDNAVDFPQYGKRSFRGRTALHWAARNGHLSVVKYLVEKCGSDINRTTVDGTSAFCWACWQGHLEVMR